MDPISVSLAKSVADQESVIYPQRARTEAFVASIEKARFSAHGIKRHGHVYGTVQANRAAAVNHLQTSTSPSR